MPEPEPRIVRFHIRLNQTRPTDHALAQRHDMILAKWAANVKALQASGTRCVSTGDVDIPDAGLVGFGLRMRR